MVYDDQRLQKSYDWNIAERYPPIIQIKSYFRTARTSGLLRSTRLLFLLTPPPRWSIHASLHNTPSSYESTSGELIRISTRLLFLITPPPRWAIHASLHLEGKSPRNNLNGRRLLLSLTPLRCVIDASLHFEGISPRNDFNGIYEGSSPHEYSTVTKLDSTCARINKHHRYFG